MITKRVLLIICSLILLSFSAAAQDDRYDPAWIKKDYNHVNIVAHVRIKSVKFVVEDLGPLYVVQCEIIEPFKGKIKRGQQFEYYFGAEESYDPNRLIDAEWIVFLTGKYPIPPGGKGWYEFENSERPPTSSIIANLRRIRSARKRG